MRKEEAKNPCIIINIYYNYTILQLILIILLFFASHKDAESFVFC